MHRLILMLYIVRVVLHVKIVLSIQLCIVEALQTQLSVYKCGQQRTTNHIADSCPLTKFAMQKMSHSAGCKPQQLKHSLKQNELALSIYYVNAAPGHCDYNNFGLDEHLWD